MVFMQGFASCSLFSRFSALTTLCQVIEPKFNRIFSVLHNGFKLNLTARRFPSQGLIAAKSLIGSESAHSS
jgi:hypothetical protein